MFETVCFRVFSLSLIGKKKIPVQCRTVPVNRVVGLFICNENII